MVIMPGSPVTYWNVSVLGCTVVLIQRHLKSFFSKILAWILNNFKENNHACFTGYTYLMVIDTNQFMCHRLIRDMMWLIWESQQSFWMLAWNVMLICVNRRVEKLEQNSAWNLLVFKTLQPRSRHDRSNCLHLSQHKMWFSLAYLFDFGLILFLLPLSLQSLQPFLLSSLLFFTHAFEFGR